MKKHDHYLKTRYDVFNTQDAVRHLKLARDLLRRAGAMRAADRVRLALTSAEGALRHAERKKTQFDATGETVIGRRFRKVP